jgi:hypothetical protein
LRRKSYVDTTVSLKHTFTISETYLTLLLAIALGIHEDLDDRVSMATDYGIMGLVFGYLNMRREAMENINKGLNILLRQEEKTGYRHPMIETLKRMISIVSCIMSIFLSNFMNR